VNFRTLSAGFISWRNGLLFAALIKAPDATSPWSDFSVKRVGMLSAGPIVNGARDPVAASARLAEFTLIKSSVCLRMSSPVKMPNPFIFALVTDPIP